MSYYFNKVLTNANFETTIELVTEALKAEGFGVLTEIDMQATLKKKLDVDFRKYRILGACNPDFAYKALQNEDKIGLFLPCNIIVQELENGEIEVAAVDPVASMLAVGNNKVEVVASEVQMKLKRLVDAL